MHLSFLRARALLLCALLLCYIAPALAGQKTGIEKIVSGAIRPAMERYGIPGMAVGVVVHGRVFVFNYGVMSKATGKPVADDTLFEIGSISKTFTATLASYAQATGHLSLSDQASKYLPALRGSSFDHVSLINLGTHTSGGLPQQVPDEIQNQDQLMRYFQMWKPTCDPGACRTYANASIGMLGLIAASSMHEDFSASMDYRLFPMLGLKHTYINVPSAEMDKYAQGYTQQDAPIRMSPGVLAQEAYGVRTTARDMAHFVAENISPASLGKELQRAIVDTHIGYFIVGPMTQDLIWEQYPFPTTLNALLLGNSAQMSSQSNPTVKLSPQPPQKNVILNKTGSTNGFGSYVLLCPGKKIGVVLLANKNYPIDARVTVAWIILTQLEQTAGNTP
jgi:beta-lactamase class C